MKIDRVSLRICSKALVLGTLIYATIATADAQTPQYVVADLGTLGGNSYAYGVNNLGQVTGQSFLSNGSNYHMFLYSSGTMSDCPAIAGFTSNYSVGYAISNYGAIAGTEYNDTEYPFYSQWPLRYSNGSISILAQEGRGFGINGFGDIAGAYGQRAGNSFSLYYIPSLYINNGSMEELDPLALFPELFFAQAVNN